VLHTSGPADTLPLIDPLRTLRPLARVDSDKAEIALREIILSCLRAGNIHVTGLAVAIGSAVERETQGRPRSTEHRFKVGMELLNMIAGVTGWFEFMTDPLHIRREHRAAPYILSPKLSTEDNEQPPSHAGDERQCRMDTRRAGIQRRAALSLLFPAVARS
jgi:hypothetical protein